MANLIFVRKVLYEPIAGKSSNKKEHPVGIRETLNQNPAITTGATAVIILVALGFIVYQLVGGGPSIPSESYYTTDVSSPEAALAALFVDDISKIPPFEKGGKDAYRAQVFTCDNGKTKFVAYCERYTPEAKQKMNEMRTSKEPPTPGADMIMMQGVEYCKPGSNEWINQSDFTKVQGVLQPKCPDGSMTGLEPVRP